MKTQLILWALRKDIVPPPTPELLADSLAAILKVYGLVLSQIEVSEVTESKTLKRRVRKSKEPQL